MRSVFYHKNENHFYLCSQPNILKAYLGLALKDAYSNIFNAEYFHSNKEYWLPGSINIYKNVERIIPNHYLDLNTFNLTRFWPNKNLEDIDFNEAKNRAIECLQKSMTAIAKRYKLAISLTAGYDTRLILASIKNQAKNHLYYSLVYDDVDENNIDNILPSKIAQKLGLKYQKIICKEKTNTKDINQHLDRFYLARKFLAEASIGLNKNFPKNVMAIKGDCPGISKNFYKSNASEEEIKLDDLIAQEKPWMNIPAIEKDLIPWFEEIKKISKKYHYRILDLFYWEQRMPGWLAHGLIEWDEAMDVYSPFNQRAYHEILLGIHKKHRTYPDFVLIKSMIRDQWPALMQFPFNPLKGRKSVKRKIRSILSRMGIYENPLRRKL